jgi:16S rRNA (guanine966-N2)-methyltransferase
MRIVSGRWAGVDLVSPGQRVRPTKEEIRSELFDTLEPDLAGAKVLDLFAGTGALGLEALSRGAKSVDFVENGAPALHALKANVAKLKARNWTRIFKKDAFVFLTGIPNFPDDEPAYDLVVADPPYTSKGSDRLATLWIERPFSRILCIEHSAEHRLPRPGKRRGFGTTMVTTYRMKKPQPTPP